MYSIGNETTTIRSEDGPMTFADLARLCTTAPKPEGLTIEEMRQRFKLADAVELASDTIELEDAQYELLRKIVREFRWTIPHQDLIAFADAIEDAKRGSVPKDKR